MSCEVTQYDGEGNSLTWPVDGQIVMIGPDIYNVWGDCSTSLIYDETTPGPDVCEAVFYDSECQWVDDGMNEPPWGFTGSMGSDPWADFWPMVWDEFFGVWQFIGSLVIGLLALIVAVRVAIKWFTRGARA